MALYLGNQKVTPSITNTIVRTITQDTGGQIISDITDTTYITQEDPDNLTANLPVINEWVRPNGWPDLDALPALDEGVYLTYDNTSRVDQKWAAFRFVMNTGNCRIALGHVNNNTWIQDEYWDVASNTYKEINYGTNTYSSYNYIVFKITPASTNHIQQFYFALTAQATLGTYAARPQHDQFCLERVGKLPYLTTTYGSNNDSYRYCAERIERDKVEFGNTLTSLYCAWYRGRRLQKVEFGNWTGANCNITTLYSAFSNCHDLEYLDLSVWDTTNWRVTDISYMFNACYRLKSLNVNWNTVNWGNASTRAITTAYIFQHCRSIEVLDLSSWDVSNWKPTSLYCTWLNCYRLKSLNVKNWNTSNWTITSLYQAWDQCQSLVDIDLSGWKTNNWAITSIAYAFRANYKRRNFDDIKYWNTSNWNITTMYAMFDSCYTVQEIDLSNWNVSNWACTDIGAAWSNCRSLRTLKVGTWNMTGTNKWAVTSIYALFNNCYNLENIDIWNWHPINWNLQRMGSAFYACYKLKEIDLTKWKDLNGNTLQWTLVNGTSHFNYFASYSYSLRKVNISNINVSAITVGNYGSNATSYSNFMECYNLEELILPATYAGHLNIRYDYNLPGKEIVRLFNALPTALEGAKIVITEMRYKLTNDQIAIATQKGYTVS